MKNSNFFLALLFLLLPFFGSAQKQVILTERSGVQGGHLRIPIFAPGENIRGTVRVLLNHANRNPTDFVFPAEGEAEAVPTFLVVQEYETGVVVHTSSLNGETFTATPYPTGLPNDYTYATDCGAVYSKFNVDFNLNDCPGIPPGETMDDKYRYTIFNADSYDNPTIFFPPSTPYMQALLGYGPANENQCITHQSNIASFRILCNSGIAGGQYIVNGNDFDSVEAIQNRHQAELNEEFPISVSPNPFSESIEISNLVNTEAVTIRIFDNSGRSIKNISLTGEKGTRQTIVTSDWLAGFYILRIESMSETKVLKLLKF